MIKFNTTVNIIFIFLVTILLSHGITLKAQEQSTRLHTVKKGESLWSIANDYKVSLDEIKQVNTGINTNKLKVKQVIKIPVTNASTTTSTKEKYHTVQKGETLYSIALKYKCEVQELRKMNDNISVLKIGKKLIIPKNLRNNTVDKARKRHVVRKGETLYFISKKYSISVDKIKSYNNMKTNKLLVGQTIYLEKKMSVPDTKKGSDKDYKIKDMQNDDDAGLSSSSVKDTGDDDIVLSDDEDDVVKEIREEGFAMLIESNIPNKKYTALHKTAKKHTLIKVKNKMNKKWIYVRVIGTIPDDGSTDDNVLIKISPAAFKKLGGVDKKFPVSIHYLN